MREFRGAWIATVHNVDWPSRDGLPADLQKAEFRAILDRAVDLKLNAIVLQVRSQCDALYPSKLEPWSPSLTGTMGKDPGYDPLAFALKECRARGLELHAWFNPFRVINSAHVVPCNDHISKTKPAMVRKYGDKIWLEPTLDAPRKLCLDVVRDVLTRYDVDGVHIDDYFYPYPTKTKKGEWMDFDDAASYKSYTAAGGKLSRDDWRRDSINRFVFDLFRTVKEVRPTCKFGISPFGIWRPGYPAQVKNSLDSYANIYADSRLWWNRGWVDYLAPQLYWKSNDAQYGFAGLYQWWKGENLQGRHLWPGIATYRVDSTEEKPVRPASESLGQVKLAREMNTASHGSGHIHYGVKTIMENRAKVSDVLKASAYSDFALIPESPWMAKGAVPGAKLEVISEGDTSVTVKWQTAAADDARVQWWLVQTFDGKSWQTQPLLAREVTTLTLKGSPAEISVRPVSVSGELGKAAGLRNGLENVAAASPVEAPVAPKS